ncbi:MAG: hypothetical protein ACHQ4G_13715, partial [Opitutales bacterium]
MRGLAVRGRQHRIRRPAALRMNDLLKHPLVNGVLPHLLTIAGFLLAVFLIARLMSEKRQPGNTASIGGTVPPIA